MSLIEIIERLCAVTKLQAEIIEKQAVTLAQAEIADEIAAELSNMRSKAAADLAAIEKEYC